MAHNNDALNKLAKLTARERQVMALVCGATDYKTIAQSLHIAENTVKSHMAHIYEKLGLADVSRSQKRKDLWQVYCDLLAIERDNLPPAPPELGSITSVDEEVRRMVEEDTRALMVIEARPLQAPSRYYREPKRSIWPVVVGLLVLFLIIAAAVAIGGAGAPFLADLLRPENTTANRDEDNNGGAAVSDDETEEPQQSNQEEEPTARPTATERPTDRPTERPEPTERPTDKPTNTPRPTARPTDIPQPTEAPNTGLGPGDTYRKGNVAVTVYDVDFREYGNNYIGIQAEIRNISNNDIALEYTDLNFSLKDNLGNSYPELEGGFSNDLVLSPDRADWLFGALCCVVSYEVDWGNSAITQVTFTITDLSSIDFAEWVLPINH